MSCILNTENYLFYLIVIINNIILNSINIELKMLGRVCKFPNQPLRVSSILISTFCNVDIIGYLLVNF